MADTVLVRMYNVGFGACFLLEFPREDLTPFRVLVDCGAHKAGNPRRGWAPEDAVRAIIADITADSAPAHLDVVVATAPGPRERLRSSAVPASPVIGRPAARMARGR